MKIVATSDLHGSFPVIPECDLLLIGGDVCPVDEPHDVIHQRNWLRTTFRDWLVEQPAKRVVWIAGNHDFACEAPGFYRAAQDIADQIHRAGGPDVTYLEDDYIEVDGLRIFGSPLTPNLRTWAFYGDTDKFKRLAQNIPEESDILLLHCGPTAILDNPSQDWAAPAISSQIFDRIRPSQVIFGHIHEGYGEKELDGIMFRNVSHMSSVYEPVNPPQVFEL